MNRAMGLQQLCYSTLVVVMLSVTIAVLYGQNNNIQMGVEATNFIVETTAIRAFVEVRSTEINRTPKTKREYTYIYIFADDFEYYSLLIMIIIIFIEIVFVRF